MSLSKQSETSEPPLSTEEDPPTRNDEVSADTAPPTKSLTVRKFSRPLVSYETAVWACYGIFTALAMYDRFDWNVWPRQTFFIGTGTAGSDRLVGYKPGPWSVVLYDALARISGRFAICCFNLLLVTRLRSLQYFMASSFVGTYLLDCSNIVNANLRLHKWNGIGLVVMTLLHVWSILLPCVTHGWGAQVVVGSFEWPFSERFPSGTKDANPETRMMSLQADDVFRMVEMTLLLGILTPLSIRWLSTKWHIGIHVHRFVCVVYFVDIVRRHSHPHSWVLNTPIFVIWLLDLVWLKYWHRQSHAHVHRCKLGLDYMVLYFSHPYHHKIYTVGPDYFLRLNDSSYLEGAHVFTTFGNHSHGLHFDDDAPLNWDVGLVVRVFRDKRKPALGLKDKVSHTMRMYEARDAHFDLAVTGPHHGEMSDLVKRSLQESSTRPVTLIAAGSGINYLLDTLQQLDSTTAGSKDIAILYTTRDAQLYEWAKKVLRNLLVSHGRDGNGGMVRVVMGYTGCLDLQKQIVSGADVEVPEGCDDSLLMCVAGRIQFDQHVLIGSDVFCQGSKTLKMSVAAVCKRSNSKFYGGLGGGSG